MTFDETARRPNRMSEPAGAAGSAQSQRGATLSPTDRIVRQVLAVDAWIAARRDLERQLRAPGRSRDERMDVERQVEALRRTHDAIKGCCARGLDAEIEPFHQPGPTAVVAHRHPWFAEKLSLNLGVLGVAVLACTDNGPEALGAVLAEQPDVLLAGDRLAMMTGMDFLAECRVYAPETLLAVQASDEQQADAHRALSDTVFLRHVPPAAVAEALVALLQIAAAAPIDA
ncbi:MAG: hypothetical protein WD794_13160 [Mycobacteriales bacterium]